MRAMMPVIAALLTALFARPAPAQQNPFIGTWGTSLMTYGGGYAAYVDFYPDGRIHFSGVVTGGGQPLHEWGTYQVNPAQSLLQYVFRTYAPHLCLGGYCEPGPPNINQLITTRYQFANPNQFILSDGTAYVRQPGNPFPDPNR